MRNWLSIAPLILLAACSRSNQQTGPAAVGYAPGSTAVTASTREPAPPPAAAPVAPTPPAANPEPVEAAEPVEPVSAVQSTVVVPAGTPIRVRLDQTVDTRSNRPGDVIHATLNKPVIVNGRTVIPAGTRFSGRVTVADASGRLKGRARISLVMDSFHMNGRTYRIRTSAAGAESSAHKKRNGVLIGGGAGLGGLIGALAGGGKGALIGAGAGAAAGTAGAAATGKLHVSLAAESLLTFRLQNAVRV